MKQKKLNKNFWIPLFFALNAIPATVIADGFDDLTAADARETFLNFEATLDGPNPNNRAALFGMVFDDCLGHFQFSNTAIDPSLKKDGSVGFRIRDVGGNGRACMASHRKANHVCGKAGSCTQLSRIDGTQFKLASLKGTVRVGLMHEDSNRDRNREIFEDFDPNSPLQHIGSDVIAIERAKKQANARQAQIDLYMGQVKGCRKNMEDLATARTALSGLQAMDEITESAVSKYTKELDQAELRLLGLRAEKLPVEELETLREELLAFAAEHEGNDEKIAPIFHKIALRYVKQKNAGTGGYDLAAATIAEAQSLEGLSAGSLARLDAYQRDIQIGRVQLLSERGLQNNFLFPQAYYSLMQGLQQDAMQACRSNTESSMESCSNVQSAMRAASQIPMRAQQTEMARYQQDMQFQMQMAQLGMPAMPMSMSSGPRWAGGAYGGDSGFTR